MNANERIISLVNHKYLERIPSFVRDHAISCTCLFIAKEYPELYQKFESEAEPDADTKQEMAETINRIFKERLEKHHV